MTKSILLTIGVLLVPAGAFADDFESARQGNWHQWRGPNANGVTRQGNPPINWDKKTNIKWKTKIPGEGSSTPIVWNDQVFVLAAINTDKVAANPPTADSRAKTKPPSALYEFAVISIDRETGKIRWQQTASVDVPHEGRHPTNTFASASPTTDGRSLYVSFGSRGIFCYDLQGNLQWKRDLGDMRTRYGWGEATSPVIYGDALIVNWDHEDDSFIVNLDAKTGKTKWKVDRDEPTSWATPLVVNFKGRDQVIVNGTNRARSYDLASGEVVWQCGGQTVNAIPSPVRYQDTVVCMSGYRGQAAYSIPLDSTGDLTDSDKVVWSFGRATPYVPSPIAYRDLIYFTRSNSAVLSCLDAVSGKPVIDAQRLPELRSLYASPVGAAERIYFVDRDGTTLVIQRSRQLELLATNKLEDPIDASPAIVGRQIFLRSRSNLYCIEESSNSVRYLRRVGSEFRPETEITTQTENNRTTVTSVTQRGESKLTIESHYDSTDRLENATVTLQTGDDKKVASATVTDGMAHVTRADGSVNTFDCPSGIIVTSAPDWTDTVMIMRRYDDKRGGEQEFPGLWIHPTRTPLRPTFKAKKLGEDSVERDGKQVTLGRFLIVLRNNSRYLGWRNAKGELVRLTPEKRPDQGIVLEGWEKTLLSN